MRNLVIPEQSWTLKSETAEAHHTEATEKQEVQQGSADLEYFFTYGGPGGGPSA